MKLISRLKAQGAWLFRWRSYLPLLMIAIIFSAMNQIRYPLMSHQVDLLWEINCLMISVFGFMIRVLTVGFVPRGTSGRNTSEQRADFLNTTGMYSIVRNPLYLGNFFIYFGISLFARTIWVCAVFFMLFCLYYERIIIAEESYLISKYKGQFLEWASRTPAFFPSLWKWKNPSLPFSFKSVLRREYPSFFGIISTFALLELYEDFIVLHHLEFDFFWLILFISAIIIYATLLFLKRKTTLLETSDR